MTVNVAYTNDVQLGIAISAIFTVVLFFVLSLQKPEPDYIPDHIKSIYHTEKLTVDTHKKINKIYNKLI